MADAETVAAGIRARIERGELRPGDRVPSARSIVREFGVAIATASRAHALLRDAGLVRAQPGVGTVVRRPPAPRRPAPRAALDVERVVAAAVAIADAEGLEGLSMRRLATELDAGAMTLYRHVADKDDLVLRMLDAVLRGWRPPAVDGAGWRDCLEAAARGLWWLFRRHPWLAPALSLTRPQVIEGGLDYTEWVVGALESTGLDVAARFDIHLTVFTWVRGIAVNLESESAAAAATGMDAEQWMDSQEGQLLAVSGKGRYPLFRQLVAGGYDFSLDGIFERGLRYLLDGLAAELG
jgi:DNA-binding transcriptional regulator YhcF (GntR family)